MISSDPAPQMICAGSRPNRSPIAARSAQRASSASEALIRAGYSLCDLREVRREAELSPPWLLHVGPSEELRTVIVIEEAHNLVGAERTVMSPEVGDPRGHATRLVVRLLAEARAYGVGLVIIDQTPAAVKRRLGDDSLRRPRNSVAPTTRRWALLRRRMTARRAAAPPVFGALV